jgi:CubicO group peptidase (beta-lactamase class C family)
MLKRTPTAEIMRRLVTLLLLTPTLASAQGRLAANDSIARAIDRVFDGYRDTEGPGCAVGVSRNGSVIYEHGYGMANLETGTPIKPASIFHVASVSKQFTAMAIMLLEKDGKLSVDDNIRKYLPEIPDYGTPITIRHLLTHTSGLRDQWELLSLARGRFEENRITDADVLDIVSRQTALNYKPGAEYVYSNTGFTLLSQIVKRVSGKSLRDFADERIFKPLGMTSTHFHDDYNMLVPGRTSAYSPRGAGWRVAIPNFDTYGATSLYTTVGDLLKWENNFDMPRVGDADLFARMQRKTLLTNGDTSSYGFGIAVGQYREADLIDHNGADAGYRAYAGRFPRLGVAIAIACNAATANTGLQARGVADAVLGKELAPVPAAATVAQQAIPMDTMKMKRLVGLYFQPTTLNGFELVFRNSRLQQGTNGPVLTPVAENTFKVGAAPGDIFVRQWEPAIILERRLPSLQPVPYERHDAGKPTPELLKRYVGDYRSDELGGTVYHVDARDSTLFVKTGTQPGYPARLAFDGVFQGGGWIFEFAESRGKVTGFAASSGRMRRVKFVKQ